MTNSLFLGIEKTVMMTAQMTQKFEIQGWMSHYLEIPCFPWISKIISKLGLFFVVVTVNIIDSGRECFTLCAIVN